MARWLGLDLLTRTVALAPHSLLELGAPGCGVAQGWVVCPAVMVTEVFYEV
jgi:hypothetical protein